MIDKLYALYVGNSYLVCDNARFVKGSGDNSIYTIIEKSFYEYGKDYDDSERASKILDVVRGKYNNISEYATIIFFSQSNCIEFDHDRMPKPKNIDVRLINGYYCDLNGNRLNEEDQIFVRYNDERFHDDRIMDIPFTYYFEQNITNLGNKLSECGDIDPNSNINIYGIDQYDSVTSCQMVNNQLVVPATFVPRGDVQEEQQPIRTQQNNSCFGIHGGFNVGPFRIDGSLNVSK